MTPATARSIRTWHRMAALASAASALVLGVVVGVASPAAAFPSSCQASHETSGSVYAWCTGGSGQVQAVVGCEWFGWWTVAYGPWRTVPNGSSPSVVSCPFPYGYKWHGFNAKD
jgi:hypothetical protein